MNAEVMVQVVQRGDAYIATSTDGRLRGVQWRWWGGAYVEVGLTPGVSGEWTPVTVLNVWDYEAGAATLERSWAAFGRFIADRYLDDDEVTGLVAELVEAAW